MLFVLFLQKKHLPKSFSVFFVFLIMVGFGFGITTLLSNSLNEFSSNFPKYQVLLKIYAENFFSFLEELSHHKIILRMTISRLRLSMALNRKFRNSLRELQHKFTTFEV